MDVGPTILWHLTVTRVQKIGPINGNDRDLNLIGYQTSDSLPIFYQNKQQDYQKLGKGRAR